MAKACNNARFGVYLKEGGALLTILILLADRLPYLRVYLRNEAGDTIQITAAWDKWVNLERLTFRAYGHS